MPEEKAKLSLKEGLIYGLMPHIGCIAFIAASILGVTVAVEFFKPLLLNPFFFHFLIALSFVFATVSAALYLRKNGILSWNGVKRKKQYLSLMYGTTIGVNLFLFLFVFPLTANFDTGSFGSNVTAAASLGATAGVQSQPEASSIITLQVEIPCSGHAALIVDELKKLEGVKGVKYISPDQFAVDCDFSKVTKEQILGLEVFKTYKAKIVG
ncbi:MAG: hypothetical protein V1494_08460 [Candidatus Diapherotrites archaeon]